MDYPETEMLATNGRRGRNVEGGVQVVARPLDDLRDLATKEPIEFDKTRLLATVERLRRFLSPAVADLIILGNDEALRSQRCEVSVAFLDLRGFTHFAASEAPEDVMFVLQGFHHAVGPLAERYCGTLERFTGDGVMVYFNGPVHVRTPEMCAVSFAVAVQERVATLAREWRLRGAALALGAGVSHGFATVGAIGFEGRYDYAAIGTVTNLASRLCSRARAGETLVCPRVMKAVEAFVEFEEIRGVQLHGFRHRRTIFRVKAFKPKSADRPGTA